LIHKGSSVSREDSGDRMEEALERVERRLDAMEQGAEREGQTIPKGFGAKYVRRGTCTQSDAWFS